jgi:CheY-like chemotaxis protein
VTFEEEHKGHKVEEVPCDLVKKMTVCFTCGEALIETKYPLEYIILPAGSYLTGITTEYPKDGPVVAEEVKLDYEHPVPSGLTVLNPTEPEPFSERATAPTIPVPRIANKPRVLVVDDEPTIARALERLLRPDYDAVAVSDSFDALETARKNEFEVALVDVHMPGMDGFQIREALLQMQPLIRVVLMTGGMSPGEQHRLAGLDSVEKPFTMGQLEDLFKKWRILHGT